ncbi:hypothetical protein BDM02DRAFT_2989356 [Thelephora ganbajun]|uniref:Uncharacterized protein n=1 Tax=Thelephora ganbajun TaxID=370292 RepID=A0ACB6ZAM0_THEGA|nr:hypothetical protein BDM02DRAFT_2989356 [Thelephora ganbajun]
MSQAFIPYGDVAPWSAAALRLRNSQHAAILRIPSEILVSILRQVIKTSSGYLNAMQLIISICHHLRVIVFGTPELWGFITMSKSIAPLFLERCQGNPISVVPFFMEGKLEGNGKILNCLNYWKNMPNLHLTRVELIEFCGTYEEFTAVSWIFNYHMPNLETLTLASGTIVTGRLDLDEDVEVWNVSPNTRCTLKDVYLQQIFIPWWSNIFYGLSTLHLDYRGFIPGAASIPMDPFLEVLSHSPRLEKCFLSFVIPQCHSKEVLRDIRPTRIIELPLLDELTLFDKTLSELEDPLSTLFPHNSPTIDTASRIALQHKPATVFRPALEIGRTTIQYLDEWAELIDPNDITHTTFTLPLVEAVHRTGPSVWYLTIRLYCGLIVQPSVWKDILEHLPNLEVLAYVPGEIEDHHWSAFWNLLCQMGENGLISCLVARWKLGRPLDVFQLRVWNCERSLAQQIIACLSPFVGQLIFEVVEERQVVRLA